MIYIVIIAVGVLAVLLLGAKALGGPNPRKALKRRVELIKERHADGILAANAQAQIRKLMAARDSRVEGIFSTLIPRPALMRQRLERTGKNISLGKYAMASSGLALFVAALLMLRGAPIALAFFAGLFIGIFLMVPGLQIVGAALAVGADAGQHPAGAAMTFCPTR